MGSVLSWLKSLVTRQADDGFEEESTRGNEVKMDENTRRIMAEMDERERRYKKEQAEQLRQAKAQREPSKEELVFDELANFYHDTDRLFYDSDHTRDEAEIRRIELIYYVKYPELKTMKMLGEFLERLEL